GRVPTSRPAIRGWPGGPTLPLFRIIPPQPAQRIGQDRAAVFGVVAFAAELELVVVTHEFQRGGHLLIRQRPVSMKIVEVVRAVLQKDADRFLFGFSDQRLVVVAAANVREAADRAEHFAEFVRTLPRHGPRANAAGTNAGDRAAF